MKRPPWLKDFSIDKTIVYLLGCGCLVCSLVGCTATTINPPGVFTALRPSAIDATPDTTKSSANAVNPQQNNNSVKTISQNQSQPGTFNQSTTALSPKKGQDLTNKSPLMATAIRQSQQSPVQSPEQLQHTPLQNKQFPNKELQSQGLQNQGLPNQEMTKVEPIMKTELRTVQTPGNFESIEDAGNKVYLASDILASAVNPFLDRLPKPLATPKTVDPTTNVAAPPVRLSPLDGITLKGIAYNPKAPMALISMTTSGKTDSELVRPHQILMMNGSSVKISHISSDSIEIQDLGSKPIEKRVFNLPNIVGYTGDAPKAAAKTSAETDTTNSPDGTQSENSGKNSPDSSHNASGSSNTTGSRNSNTYNTSNSTNGYGTSNAPTMPPGASYSGADAASPLSNLDALSKELPTGR